MYKRSCELAHEVDAMAWLSVGACIPGWGVGWGRIITSLALSHIRHATLPHALLDFHACVMLRYCTFSWTSAHASCYATVRSLGLPYVMLRYCTFS